MADVDSDLIQSLQDVEVPDVRVYLQTLDIKDGLQVRGGDIVKEIKGWNQVTFGRTKDGVGQAQINFVNTEDRYVRRKDIRVLPANDAANFKEYFATILTKYLSIKQNINFINPERRRTSFEGAPNIPASLAQINDYIQFIYDFATNTLSEFDPANPEENLIQMGLMQRVFIDVLGRDGQIYAGFTGFVSGIGDQYRVGAMPMLTLHCRDMYRYFAMTEILIKQGVAPILESIAADQLTDPSLRNAYKNNVFSGFTGPEIIRQVVRITQAVYTFEGHGLFIDDLGRAQGLNLAQQIANILENPNNFEVPEEEFFQTTRFWDTPPSDQLVGYQGQSTLRRVVGRVLGQGIQDGDSLSNLVGQVLIDKYINQGLQGLAYETMIDNIMGPFQSQRATGEAIFQRLKACTHYEIFCNGNGDLVYQIPKYNNLPAEVVAIPVAPGGGTSPASDNLSDILANLPNAEARLAYVNNGTHEINFTQQGEFDYSPPPENFFWKQHGEAYIVTDASFVGLNTTQSEEGLATSMTVPVGGELIKQDETLEQLNSIGRTKRKDNLILQRRFGLRYREAQRLFLRDFLSPAIDRQFLDAYAQSSLNLVNAESRSAVLETKNRVDLDVGLSAILLERQRIAYISGVSHTAIQGKRLDSTLSLIYVRDIAERITSPWVTISLENRVKPQAAFLVTESQKEFVRGSSLTTPHGEAEAFAVFGQVPANIVNDPNFSQTGFIATDSHGLPVSTSGPFAIESFNISGPSPSGFNVQANPLIKGALIQAFAEFKSSGLFVRYPGFQFLGAYVPKRLDRTNPKSAISRHALGIALDFNPNPGPFPGRGIRIPEVAPFAVIMKRWGFAWGGDWSNFDDIHFQYMFESATPQSLPQSTGEH